MRTSYLAMNGKTDDSQILAVMAWLREQKGFTNSQMKKDHFLKIDRQTWTVSGPYRDLPKVNAIVHCPDITVLDKSGNIWFVIELDGSIHGKLKHKTHIRNEHYTSVGIKCIALDIPGLRDIKMSWWEYLDIELERVMS